MTTTPVPELSVVVPVYNEAGNILPLAGSTVDVLTPLGRSFEMIMVNDGSTDGTAAEIAEAARRWPQCRELRMPKNSGQAIALLTGLRAARGKLIITMDGDGQNDPKDIPALLARVDSGQLDVACGWRVDRHDTWARRKMSRLAYAARRIVLNDRVHDSGCQLRVFRPEVREVLEPMELMQSFLPAIVGAAGFRVGELPVRHHARKRGESKYGLGRLWWRPALAMLALRLRLWRRYGFGGRKRAAVKDQ